MNAIEADAAERRVLILALTPRDASMSRTLLEDAGLSACVCRDLLHICREIDSGAGAVLLNEECLGPEQSRYLRDVLAAQPPWSDLPILVLTRGGADSLLARHALETLGNVTLMERPVRVNTLVSTARTAIRARERQYQLRRHLAERARSTEALRELNETLEQRVAERTELAEQQATQLRALASALTQAELRERRRLAQVLHDHLQQILVAAKLHLGLLSARIRAPELHGSLVQLGALIDKSIEASRDLTIELSPPVLYQSGLTDALQWLKRWMFDKHGLQIELDTDPAAEPASEDVRVLIFAIVRELLFNVVKHAGTRQARVETRLRDDGIMVVVSDEGAGFDAVRRVHETADGGGFGLFSIQQRLALEGGRFHLDSAPGHGTRATLYVPLPFDAEATTAVAEHRNGRPSQSVPPTGCRHGQAGPIRVLLVDDHRILREGVAGLLGDEPDIDVVAQAADGESAIDIARQVSPDVIIMDINLPQMNGIEATRRIKAEQPHVRIIGLSMNEKVDMATALRDAGAIAYLTKGGPAGELIAAIRGDGDSD